jgi:hypothetical protein
MEIKMTKIETAFGPCYFREMVWKQSKRTDEKICPFCLGPIQTGDKVFLVITNYVLFPNVICHIKCAKKVDEEIVKRLMDSYGEAKEAFKKATECWFAHLKDEI